MNEKFPHYFLLGMIMLALGMGVIAIFTSKAIRDAKKSGDTISVTGSARKTIKSDYGTLSINVGRVSPDINIAYNELQIRANRLHEFLNAHGVPDSSIEIAGVRCDGAFNRSKGENEWIGHNCTQRFDIHSSQVDSIESWSKVVTELIPEFVDFRVESPRYFYTKVADLRIAMMGQATQDARTRAEMIATNAGGKIGSVRSAKMGVIQITAPNSRDVSDQGMYDVTSIDKDITAVVNVTFTVEAE